MQPAVRRLRTVVVDCCHVGLMAYVVDTVSLTTALTLRFVSATDTAQLSRQRIPVDHYIYILKPGSHCVDSTRENAAYCAAVLIDRIMGFVRPAVCPSVPYRLLTRKRKGLEKL